MNLEETRLSGTHVFRGRIISVRVDEAALPDGSTALREVVEHPGGVCVAALTADGELLFVRQFRYPYGRVLSELPAGKRDPGEDPLLCGQRELREETGASAARWTPMGTLYPSPGYVDEVIHLYLAEELTMGTGCPDADEFLEVTRIPLAQAAELVMAGALPDAKTQVLVLKVAERLRQSGG